MFRSNQKNAIAASLANNFASGVHFHATGTGKSWIALQLALEFQARAERPTTILWICEHKSILAEQFDRETLKARGFADVGRRFLIHDFSVAKPADWVDRVSSAAVWRRPMLVIVNRAFLTSCLRYQRLRCGIDLVIHDECHTITNATTQAFYGWLREAHPAVRCIGFSATPTLAHAPYTSLLSSYSIYDACADGAIVPPTVAWIKAGGVGSQISESALRRALASLLVPLPYKKCVVWCGMIDACYRTAAAWRGDPLFAGWTMAVDTSAMGDVEVEVEVAEGQGEQDVGDFATYEEFRGMREKAILFCASKHREGSDIPNLDACIFLDRVVSRNAKTFVQCIGRVLRRDAAGAKTTGLIVDICAASSIRICDRINAYLNPGGAGSAGAFPFRYNMTRTHGLQIHTLTMTSGRQDVGSVGSAGDPEKPLAAMVPLAHRFIRTIPTSASYRDRLDTELAMFEAKGLAGHVHQALDILESSDAARIPHVTRGSCGSSLVCYLLGISHVDPVRWGIRFARFLNEFRNTLPDIDFDFPHFQRDDVFLQIQMRWPGQVARISNHIHYHKKSAMREAIRRAGVRRQLSALQLMDTVRRMETRKRAFVFAESKRLENTFRGYSLHCGGIVFYPAGVPAGLRLNTARSATLSQIRLNKQGVSAEGQFKIDILSSRALSQLIDARKFAGLPADPEFDTNLEDAATAALFRRADNIGITLAETPLMHKAFLHARPGSVADIAYCLAVIRPAAREARRALATGPREVAPQMSAAAAAVAATLVFDDDVIDILAGALGCTDAEADQYRRAIAKNDKRVVGELKERLKRCGKSALLPVLKDVRNYSFCKSHAFSYAQLVWQLGYMKAHHPAAFWRSALKHCESSYRKWVHLYEARLAGVRLEKPRAASIFAENRRRTAEHRATTPLQQLRSLGIWAASDDTFFADCYFRQQGERAEIRGLIAWTRTITWDKRIKRVAILVGVGPHQYIEVIATGTAMPLAKSAGITCGAAVLTDTAQGIWTAEDPLFW